MSDASCLKLRIRECLWQLWKAPEPERANMRELALLLSLISKVAVRYTDDIPNHTEDIAHECLDYVYQEMDRIMAHCGERGHKPESVVYFRVRQLARAARRIEQRYASWDSFEGLDDRPSGTPSDPFEVEDFCRYLRGKGMEEKYVAVVKAYASGGEVGATIRKLAKSRATAYRLWARQRPTLAAAYRGFFAESQDE